MDGSMGLSLAAPNGEKGLVTMQVVSVEGDKSVKMVAADLRLVVVWSDRLP